MWDRWNSYSHENGFGDAEMNSFNHYAYGAIGTWMVENILGLRPDPKEPGFKHFVLGPRLGGELTYAQGGYQSPYGRIESNWELKGDSFTWNVVIPPNTSATVFLPIRKDSQILEGDGFLTEAAGVTLVRQMNSCVELMLLSGHYHFQVFDS